METKETTTVHTTERTKTTSNVHLQVTVKSFNDQGQLLDELRAGAHLTVESDGRHGYADTHNLSFSGVGCSDPKLAFDYSASSREGNSGGAKTTTVETEVQLFKPGMTKDELILAVAAGSVLSKADAGRAANTTLDEFYHVGYEKNPNLCGHCACTGDCGSLRPDTFYNATVREAA